MKNKIVQKLLRKKKSDSGFTLLELLTGLTMSGIVVGALGFGLYQILKTTSNDASQTQAREQASRAIEFITDEIRRARTIDGDASNATNFPATDSFGNVRTVVLALDIPEINDGDTLDTDNDANTSERIVYYLQSDGLDNWRGPQVLYRWGPPLDANGNYTNGSWQPPEALIDGIDDTVISNPCASVGGTQTPATAKGFYACLSGPTVGNFNTAQIFLTGEISNVAGENTNFTSDTQAVARAKVADPNQDKEVDPIDLTLESLGAEFNCNGQTKWTMRTDFGQSNNNPSDTHKWIHDPDRQGQVINIDQSKPLYITSVPVNASGCHNQTPGQKFNGKENGTMNKSSTWYEDADSDGQWDTKSTVEVISHKIDFNDPLTFNGNEKDGDHNDADVIKPNGDSHSSVKILKRGTEVPNYGGYDSKDDGIYTKSEGDQKSLGQFLADKGYAQLENGKYVITDKLQENQRIIAMEIGQNDQSHPGFDLQDNIFIVTSDAFKKEFESSYFQ